MVAKAEDAVVEPLNIFQIISKISEEAGALAKTMAEGSGLKFAFRGIDGVINHLSPYFQKYGVVVIPAVVDKVTSTREIQGGKAITQTDLTVMFTFYAPDGTSVAAQTVGLAQDYADRSAAQAQSVALRVALLQTFFLPTQDREPEVAGEDTQKYIENNAATAATAATAVKSGPKQPDITPTQMIGKLIADPANMLDGEAVNTIGNGLFPKKKDRAWFNSLSDMTELHAHLQKAIENGEYVVA
jgi:hypothetical protein